MQLIKTFNWYYTPEGDPRGYIDPHALKELWFHTGTACNLACPFCLEGSAPGDRRLDLVKFADVQPLIDEAVKLGVQQFSFTGGEPFLARDLVKILEYASRFGRCLVLTNGTKPLHRRMHQLQALVNSKYPVTFRISLDYADAIRHDRGRGEGNFSAAIEGIRLLQGAGFQVSIARQMEADENPKAVEDRYRRLLQEAGANPEVHFVAFPDFATPGARPRVPQVTTHCMTNYQTEESRREFMCAFSKMVIKKDGRMRIYACTLVDDDPEYDLGGTLKESMEHRISLKHHRCYSCFAYGASCSES